MPDDFDFSQNGKRKRNKAEAPDQPLMTQVLCLLCVVITLAYFTSNAAKGTLWYTVGHFGLVSTEDIWSGRYYGLLSSFFVHLSILHIYFNMTWLWRLGGVLETTIAPWKYIIFLIGAGIVGSCSELALSGQTGAGASGVVYAIFGLLWAGRGSFAEWRSVATRQNLNLFVGWGLLCVVLTYAHIMPIANGAHWGGFAYGLAVGWIFFAPRRRPIWWLALAGLGAICVMSLFWMPWSWVWNWDQGGRKYEQKNYREALRLYERSLRTGGTVSPLKENIADCWQMIAVEAEARHDRKAMEEALTQAKKFYEEAKTAQVPKEVEPERPPRTEDLIEQIRKKAQKPPADKK